MTVRRIPAAAWLLLRRALKAMLETGTREAAQVAFYLLMSFPAILLLLVWGFSGVLGDDSVQEKIVDAIAGVLPVESPADRDTVEALLGQVASGAGSLGWLGAVTLLYSASSAIGALRYAVDRAWGVAGPRPYVPGKGLDIALTLVAAPLALVALGLTLSGALAEAIGDHPWLVAAAQFAVTRALPAALLLAILVTLLRLLPAERASLRSAWPGALFALVLILLVHAGTTAYFAAFGDASAVYGTLGILLGLVFSAYLVSVACVAGAHLSAELARLPDAAAIEGALSEPTGPGGMHFVVERLRGLFVRTRE